MSEIIDNQSSLEEEYENYQYLAEQTIQDMSGKLITLEKKMDNYSALIEMIRHINVHIQDRDIMYLLNDMLLGIIGSTYSTIYESGKNGTPILKVTNSSKPLEPVCERCSLIKIKQFEPFILNNENTVFKNNNTDLPVHSILGMPIILKGDFMGYILLEHDKFDYFNNDHLLFLSAIASQLAILLENHRLYREIQEFANKDTLLNMFNRRYFYKFVRENIDISPEKPFGIIMIDIDFFKKVNDTYGHQFGDEVLIKTADTIVKHIGSDGVCARYGGEEIIIYLKNINNYDKVYKNINELREKVQNTIVKFNGVTKGVTISLGISVYRGSVDNMDSVIKTADELLYEAKESGRNKLIMQDFDNWINI